MYTNYFEAIDTMVSTEVPSIQEVSWFNKQYESYADPATETLPAVFVAFEQPTLWQMGAEGLQTADTIIRLHLVVHDTTGDPATALSAALDLHKIVQGATLKDTEGTRISSTLVRVESNLISSHTDLQVIVLGYRTTLYAYETMPEYTEVTASLTTQLN